MSLLRDVLSPYGQLLRRHLPSDLTRAPVAAYAAHAGVGPIIPGGALFAFWQAAYHRFGQWHAQGGAGALTSALVSRLGSLGGQVRTGTPVRAIDARSGRVTAVETDDGERIEAATVVTAVNPKVALLEMLDPPLGGQAGRDLAAAQASNVVQALVHVATDRPPPYPDATGAEYQGMQSFVDSLDDLGAAWVKAEAGLLPDPLPLYAFTTSALDASLAPAGHHTVYLACPSAPARIEGGWDERAEEFTTKALAVMEARAPGFGASVQGVRAFTPLDMERHSRWPLGHPMHLDITLDQLGPLRPTPGLAAHRTPVPGLYVTGAGTAPAGGVAGTPGKQAAQAVLADAGENR
jgi:phytoene dehydrogenase-like protein